MRLVCFTICLFLFRISVHGQILHDSIKTDVIYYSQELDNHYIIEMESKPASFRDIEREGKTRYRLNSRNYISYRKDAIKKNQKRINSEQSDFLARFNKINRKVTTKNNKLRILRQYKSAFNGFAVEADSTDIGEIKKIPHVKRVVKDRIITISDLNSNDVIGAPLVWQQTGATGKHIIIGILDTGIDPDHPELKGRVLNGYDFINDDTNPYDDHGHGTHCAGIAAANGPTLKGVAPDALLMPVKVLDAQGSGPWSTIISGINYAIDPDGDPLTDDGVKILSVSIGGPGSPDDPLAQAIDNAFEKNVLCVVAAGNNGNKYYNIGSPGCAEKALTVGASDNNDNLADFSSCGPTSTFQVKPEVLAPGVGIYSTVPHGKYETWSGTSMATPHVAGAAALLMELHPDWSPSYIKSALMESAKNINLEIWKQGKGRIDVLKATKVKTIVYPDIISFGNISDSILVWHKTQTLKIYNLQNSNNVYSVKLMQNLPAGISMSYPKTININDSLSIEVGITVDLNQYHFVNSVPRSFQNKLLIVTASDSLIIPFVLNCVNTVKILFDVIPAALYIQNDGDFANVYYPSDTIFSCVIDNPGKYNFIACFDNFINFVVKEDVSITKNSSLKIRSGEAKNKISFTGVDQNGETIPIYYGITEQLTLKSTNSGIKFSRIFFTNDEYNITTITRNISDLSDKYRWDLEYLSLPYWNKSRKPYYFPLEFSKGITGSKSVTNSKSDFITVTRKFPDRFSRKNCYLNYNYFTIGNGGSYANSGFKYDDWKSIEDGNIYTEYILPFPSKEFELRGISYYSLKEKIGINENRLQDSIVFATGNEVFYKDTLAISNIWEDNKLIRIPGKSLSLRYGILPSHYSGIFNIVQSKISICKRFPVFCNASFDLLPGKVYYKISYNGKDSSGYVYNDIYNKSSVDDYYKYIELPFNENVKKFEFSTQTSILDDIKSITTATHYRISQDFFHCNLNVFLFKEDGKITDHLRNGKKNTVEINSTQALSVKLFIKRIQDTAWSIISLKKDAAGTHWNGELLPILKKGYYSTKVIAYNPPNDSLVYLVEPAFVIYSDSCNEANHSTVHPDVVLSSSNSGNKICSGDNIVLTASGANMYKWSTRNEGSSITVETSGDFSVVGTNLDGCKDSATVKITVNPVYNTTENKIICQGQSYKGHTESGVYPEQLKTMSGCDSVIIVNLTVNNIPSPPVINLDNGILKSDADDGNQWYFENNIIQDSVNNCFAPSKNGKYYVIVTRNACSSPASNTIEVNNVVLLTDEIYSADIDIYPNPTNGLFEIKSRDCPLSEYNFSIQNISGTMMPLKLNPINNTGIQVDIYDYPPGVYLLKIYNKSGSYSSKIIKL